MPIETIVHEILPALAKVMPASRASFTFCGRSYQTRDVVVLSSAMQWFATNCGKELLERDLMRHHSMAVAPEREFLVKFEIADKERRQGHESDMATFLTHQCTTRCTRLTPPYTWREALTAQRCVHDGKETTGRDRALVAALMRWLGTSDGREFIADYQSRRNTVWEYLRKQFKRKHGLQPRAASIAA